MTDYTKGIALLKEYINHAEYASGSDKLDELERKYSGKLKKYCGESELDELLGMISKLMHRLVNQQESFHGLTAAKELTEHEKEENRLVMKLLDKNLFTYHFQPIIRADNGEIFAYEALMRAKDMDGISPYHILKYAEMTGRLAEVEQYTFLNVLKLAAQGDDPFNGKPVFINSMPDIHIRPEKNAEIEKMLSERVSRVVIEMVESSEYKDSDLDVIKAKYSALGIPIAIDDYGTGYSNISNLLRYTPNFVKIDRSLLSGIENNPNKKHFVREIIDFCHENKIMALAEGVENSEELRCVILLGADLIQGFYTARPSAEIIAEIPYALKAEICAHRQELEDGRRLQIYSAENGEKIYLERLSRDGYSCLQIGSGYNDGSITISGSPHQDSGIHLMIADGFAGKVQLENVRLSNLPGRPCVDIGGGCDVTLVLAGSNILVGGGIRVPENAMLTTEGDGSLDIKLGDTDYFGIGNDLSSQHGRLSFMQDGTIAITATSHAGVCIGAGRGGEIVIGRGRYVLNASGSNNVGIGALDGDTSVDILGCDLECTASGAFSIGIGSENGNADVHVKYSSVKISTDSQMSVGLGNLRGDNTVIHAESVSMVIEMSADALTAYGSMFSNSDIKIERSAVKISADGPKALAFGGLKGESSLTFTDIDLAVKISNTLNICTRADNESIHTKGGRYRITLNGQQLDAL
ncbi:EAL domain-containing protein [uncultured Ruminococcus sp.]|uniref:EAL domain-containing protein n=1 Tax=uncultured Ruminococcus sp. TaxID=165186 RepID=UPI000EBA1BDC|nr:EAL domain-containing protein [uncultured Ruminococcus sp.]HCJ42213.1 diguanylate phosphodiesterase [Ruminococcus sp.]